MALWISSKSMDQEEVSSTLTKKNWKQKVQKSTWTLPVAQGDYRQHKVVTAELMENHKESYEN